MRHDPQHLADKIDGLVQRFRNGDFSEVVFTASLVAAHVRLDDIRGYVAENRGAFRESLPYLRGDVR